MKLKLKDPGSAITHGIAMLLAIVGAAPLIVKAARGRDSLHIAAISIFILTMILLYAIPAIFVRSISIAKQVCVTPNPRNAPAGGLFV